MAVDKQRIFKHFNGIDNFRKNKIAEVKKVSAKRDQYNPEFIGRTKADARKAIIEDRQVRAKKANMEINEIIEDLSERKFNDPYAAAGSTEDKLLVEMQQAKEAQLLNAEISAANNADDFKPLLEQYGKNEHFHRLLELEIKKRANNTRDGAQYSNLQAEMNQEPPEVQELTRIGHNLTMMGNMDKHPAGLDGAESLENFSFEDTLGEAEHG